MKLPDITVLFKNHRCKSFGAFCIQFAASATAGRKSMPEFSSQCRGRKSRNQQIYKCSIVFRKYCALFQRGAELFSRTYCTHLYQPLVQKCHALGKDRCVHIIQKRSLCSHNVSLSTKCSLFEKFYAFEVNIARHFIHMVCQKCRAYNHKIMNFETMLPPFNAWIHLFQSKFAHDKALFDSTTVLISKSAGLKRMRKRDPHFFKESNPIYPCLPCTESPCCK